MKISDFSPGGGLLSGVGTAGVAARTSAGVAALPGNAPFEVQMVVAVEGE